MTLPTLSLVESQIFAALRTYLLSLLPAGLEVVKGQGNRVPEPKGADFLVATPILRERIETLVTIYSDGYPSLPSVRLDTQAVKYTIQVDVHGPNSADYAEVVSAIFRSDIACATFATTGYDVTPLFASDPRQMMFWNGEQQAEDRWTVDFVLQANVTMTTGQDFAGVLTVQLVPEYQLSTALNAPLDTFVLDTNALQ